MQFSIVAVLALAGVAFADSGYSALPVSAAPAQTSTVGYTIHTVVTITECPETVTFCPARVSTIYSPAANNGGAGPTGTGGYVKPTLSGYNGPAYTGAAGQVKAAGALAGVGAFAALLL